MSKKVLVIGAGPGGYVAAIHAAQLGAEVTLIEGHKVGGTCLNYGCIPTKTLYKNAEVIHTMSHLSEYGIRLEGDYTLDLPQMMARKEKVVNQLVKGVEQLIEANQITLIRGTARFISDYVIEVTQSDGEIKQLESENIIIATGSKSSVLPIEGTDLEGVLDSKALLEIQTIPKNLTIVGGGVIGMEFAGIFNALGTEVNVIEYADRLLPQIDEELSKRYTATLKRKGIKVHKGTQVVKIEKDLSGGLKVFGKNKKGEVALDSEIVLLSTGRQPAIEKLGLENTQVICHHKGIPVSENFETNIKGIYAIGDVTGQLMLAHVASHQAIKAVDDLMGVNNTTDFKATPSCIFVFPEIATVGLSEEEASAQNITYHKSKFMFAANGKALAIGEGEGFIKVLSDEQDKIIGVHILGPHASDLIHEGTLAINHHMSVKDIADTIHAHPTLSEAFAEASMGILGEAIHLSPKKK